MAETSSSPTPTPTYATTQQVASVIASHEADWREVIEGAGECRALWTFPATAADEINGMSCYLREQTIGLSAENAVRDLAAFEIPPELEALVEETTVALDGIAAVDLKALCGGDAVPAESDECNKALGTRMWGYTILETKLDAWGPYL